MMDSVKPGDLPGLKTCIIGAGSIGKLFFGYLAAAGNNVHLVARGDRWSDIASRGVEVRLPMSTESIKVREVSVVDRVSKIATLGVFDAIVVAVKAPDVREVLESIRTASGIDLSRVAIVLVQNGIGVEELARATFPTIRSSASRRTTGPIRAREGWSATRARRDTYRVLGRRPAGRFRGHRRSPAGHVHELGPARHVLEEHQGKGLAKGDSERGHQPGRRAVQVHNGRILEVPELRRISGRLTSEAVAVARAGKFVTDFDGQAAVQAGA